MPSTGDLDDSVTSVTFESVHDPFRTTDIGDDEDDGLDEKYKQLAKDIFGETDEKREELVIELREELKNRKFVVPDKKAFYIKLLRTGNLTVQGAVDVLDNYVNQLIECPRYISRAKASQAATLCGMQAHTVLPHRDTHGRRVYIFRPGKWDPDKFTFTDCYAMGYMLSEMMALEPKTQVAGVTTITDASGFGFKQFKNFTMEDARKTSRFMQDSFPLWFRTINIVNAHRFFYLAYNVVRPMLSKPVRDSIVFHPDLESLYSVVDREILPEELGGSAGKFSNDGCREMLEQMDDLFTEFKSYKREKKQ